MMSVDQFIEYIHSVTLLLSIGLVYDIISSPRKRPFPYVKRVVTGLAFSFIGIIIMSTPWEVAPGYYFDPRTIVTLISGLFFGYITTIITMISLAFYRIYLGGGGVIPGVLWVLIPGICGLIWNRIRKGEEGRYTFKELYLLSLTVHIMILLSLFTLPLERALDLIRIVAAPTLLIFPIGATLLGILLAGRIERLISNRKMTQLATVIEQLNEKIIITDLEGYPVYLNKYFQESTGYTVDEVLGTPLGLYKSGRQSDEFYSDLWNTISSGNTWRGQIINRRKDQSHYYDEATIFPITNQKGEITNYASFQRDISDQIELIKALENSESNLKTILNSIDDAVVEIDPRGRIVDLNPPLERLTGWERIDVIGKLVYDVLLLKDPLTGEKPINPYNVVLEAGRLDDSYKNMEVFSRDGGSLAVSISGSLIKGEDDIPMGVVLVIRDITDEVKMREMMIQSEKMLSIGGLAAGMAHEINNPLAGMIQTADVISGRIGENLMSNKNREAAERAGTSLEAIGKFMEERGIFRMLNSIKSSGRKASVIIQNMISFSQSGEEEKDYYNPVEIIDTTLEMMKNERDLKSNYSFQNIAIKRDFEEGLPPLFCERVKVQQVFFSVLHNAAQALDEGGVESPLITISIRSEGVKSIIFEIADNGPGMDPSINRHMFEPFYTTREVGTGTGLGLSVSYYIVKEEHGGEMVVESEPGRGTRVIITLPM